MAELITSPVELGFSEFVSKLVSDTFEAVITASVGQEEDWSNLKELLAQGLDVFSNEVVDDEMIQNELIRLFPDEEGDTLIYPDTKYISANPEKNTEEKPPINKLTGYQPKGKKLTAEDVDAIVQLIKNQLGKKQYQTLSTVMSRGATKVIVDSGKINAKLNFEILQVDPEGDEDKGGNGGNEGEGPKHGKRIFVKQKFPGFGGLARPSEMKNVHFFVKPPTDQDPQTSTVKANVYGEVEIQFKTVT